MQTQESSSKPKSARALSRIAASLKMIPQNQMKFKNTPRSKLVDMILMATCLLTWSTITYCQHSTEQQQHQHQQQSHNNHNSFESLAEHLNALATQQRHQQQQQLINNRLASALAALSSSSPSSSSPVTPSSSHIDSASHHLNSINSARSMPSNPSSASTASSSTLAAPSSHWHQQMLSSASTQTPTYASIYSPGSQYISGASSNLTPSSAATTTTSTVPASSSSQAINSATLTSLLYPPIGPLSFGQSHLYGSALANPLASLGGNSLWSAYSSPFYANSLARSSYSPFAHLYSASPRYSAANSYLSALQSFYGLGGQSAASGVADQGSSQGTDITNLLRSAAGSPYSSLFTRESSLFPSYSSSMYGAMNPGAYGQSAANGVYATPYSLGSSAAASQADPLYTSASNAYGVSSPASAGYSQAGAGMSPITLSHASPFGGSAGPRITIQPLFGSGTSSYYSLLNPYTGAGSTGSSALRSSLLGGKLGLGLGLAGLSLLG